MKSNVPWSVKGIDPEARVVAKAAAKEAGMTLGEWMNQAIRQVGTGEPGDDPAGGDFRSDDAPAPEAAPASPPSGVTTDQLRAVVDSLNRLNERLTSTEEGLRTQEAQTRQTAAGLGQGLETVYERMKRLERERKEGSNAGIETRVEKLERGEGDKGRIDGLKRLEGALTSMVEALEVTRAEAITKITENEEALDQLASRVDVLDERLTAGFSEVHDAIDAVGEHLGRTERTAAGVLADAQAAAGSTDAEFVERTSKRLQALGNEIKRSGDQIRTVEEMVGRLSAKIEAAEHRSAEGIGEVAASLDAFRAEVRAPAARAADADAAADAAEDAEGDDLAKAAAEADKKVSRLQRSYETMMARLEGRAEPVREEDDAPLPAADLSAGEAPAPAPTPTPGPAAAATPPAAPAAPDTSDTSAPEAAPQTNVLSETPEQIVPADGEDDDFDAAFADVGAPEAPKAETVQDDLPPMLGGAVPLAAGAMAGGAMLTAHLSTREDADAPLANGTDDEERGASAADAEEAPKLTARQKVLLAAKARKKRLEAEREAEGEAIGDAASGEPALEDAQDDALRVPEADDREGADGQNRKIGLGLVGLLAVLVAAMAFAGYRFGLIGGDAQDVVDAGPTERLEGRISAPPLPGPDAPAALPSAGAEAKALYDQGKVLLARGQEADALRLFEEAAVANYAPAQFRAGHAYYDGIGVDRNVDRARRLLSDAALNGNVVAMHYLGNIAVTAEEPNTIEGLDWFTQAAEAGVVSSAYNLGYLYDPTAPDQILPTDQRDAAKSYYWYSVAAKQGDEASREEAGLVRARLTPEKVAEIDAQVARWTPLPVSPTVNDGVRLPG